MAVPFLLSSRGYAVLVDTTTAASFDLAHSNTGAWSTTVPDEVLDYYLITGTPAECLTAYRDLTGPALLPPKWAFGPWISGGFRQDSAAEVRERARRIREHRFPCDVLHIDTFWQRHGSWSDMSWDTEAFPDPRGLMADLAGQGFHVSLWMNPYVGVDSPYFTGVDGNGWFLRTVSGATWVSQVWGGTHPDTAVLDLTHPGRHRRRAVLRGRHRHRRRRQVRPCPEPDLGHRRRLPRGPRRCTRRGRDGQDCPPGRLRRIRPGGHRRGATKLPPRWDALGARCSRLRTHGFFTQMMEVRYMKVKNVGRRVRSCTARTTSPPPHALPIWRS